MPGPDRGPAIMKAGRRTTTHKQTADTCRTTKGRSNIRLATPDEGVRQGTTEGSTLKISYGITHEDGLSEYRQKGCDSTKHQASNHAMIGAAEGLRHAWGKARGAFVKTGKNQSPDQEFRRPTGLTLAGWSGDGKRGTLDF